MYLRLAWKDCIPRKLQVIAHVHLLVATIIEQQYRRNESLLPGVESETSFSSDGNPHRGGMSYDHGYGCTVEPLDVESG